jgi:hypothetical protein
VDDLDEPATPLGLAALALSLRANNTTLDGLPALAEAEGESPPSRSAVAEGG